MQSAAPALRRQLAEYCHRFGGDQLGKRIAALCYSADPKQREVGLELVATDPRWQESLHLLKAFLKDPELALREKAVRVLSQGYDNPTVFLMLRDLIHDEEVSVRRHAIRGLAESKNPDIAEVFLERLPEEERGERDLMIQALSVLAKDPRSHLDDKVIPVLADESEDVRDAAVELLRRMPNLQQVLRTYLCQMNGRAAWLRERCKKSLMKVSSNLVEPLLALLEDPLEDVRVAAVGLAQDFHDPRLIPAVGRIFQSDADWWVRNMAAEVLANYPHTEVVELLASKLEEPEMKYGIVFAMGKMQTPMVVPYLLAALADPIAGSSVDGPRCVARQGRSPRDRSRTQDRQNGSPSVDPRQGGDRP